MAQEDLIESRSLMISAIMADDEAGQTNEVVKTMNSE